MKKAYLGRILWIDLSRGEIRAEEIPDEVYEQHLSGMGLGAYILYHRIPADADPLGPDNILGFCSGLLTGTASLFSGRWTLVGKSPLTGGWGDANCGGTLSPAIKRCGYDALFFSGISPAPVYLHLKNGRAELRDATGLWGADAVETEERLQREHGGRAAVAVIGPAGEKLSLMAGVCNDRGRIAARSGLGAVMGSKRLKAVVLEGAGRIGAGDAAAMKRLSRHCARWVRLPLPLTSGGPLAWLGTFMRLTPVLFPMDGLVYRAILQKWGTGGMNQMSIEMGDAPIKNWAGSNRDFPRARSKTVNPDRIRATETVKYHCSSCPLGCGGLCSAEGKFSNVHKPEYESILSLGGLCLNGDLDSLFHLNELLNRAGMDTISAGAAAAFAFECYEKGILTSRETDGLELNWGNSSALTALIEKMIRREGVGDLLADGTKVAAAKIGRGAMLCAVHAGGQEPAMHDGRNDPGFNVHYCLEPTPGRHTIGAQLYYEMFQLWKRVPGLPKPRPLFTKASRYRADGEKAAAAAACSKFVNLANGAGMCLFGLFLGAKRIPLFDWLNAATGWRRTPEAYLAIGGRIQTLKQAFNVRHGIEPRSFFISPRALGVPPQDAGANRGRTVEIEKLAPGYWSQFGWDPETGKPGEEQRESREGRQEGGAAAGEEAPPYRITEKCSGCGACARFCPVGAIRGRKPEPHAIDPALCIACGACGRVCPEQAVAAASGEPCLSLRRSQWLRPRFDLKACLACTACAGTCPTGSIALAAGLVPGSLHRYPRLANAKTCIGCGFCAADCPAEAVTLAAEPPAQQKP